MTKHFSLHCAIGLSLILFISCSDKEKRTQIEQTKDGHVRKKEYNQKGILIYEQEFLKKDTGLLADGIAKEYYDDGQVCVSGTYKNGNLHGLLTTYYRNGNLKHKFGNLMGAWFGAQYEYYEDGELMNFVHFRKPMDPWNPTSDGRFLIHFDMEHKVDSVDGHPLIVDTDERTSYQKSDTALLHCYFINDPEGFSGKLVVKMRTEQNLTETTFTSADARPFIHMRYLAFPYSCSSGSATITFLYSLYPNFFYNAIVNDSVTVKIVVRR